MLAIMSLKHFCINMLLMPLNQAYKIASKMPLKYVQKYALKSLQNMHAMCAKSILEMCQKI